MEVLNYIAQRKEEIRRMLAIDHAIKADPYDNVARLKELEKVEKIIKQKRRRFYEVLLDTKRGFERAGCR